MNTHLENQEADCKHISEVLSAYFDGAANVAEQQMATAHLAQCSSCAEMWSEWQNLRLMEQRALEPVASGEMLPLAPVKAPRHLKAAILRQTVATPIWQHFWPRLLTGMAVPTVAVACWLLVVASPWQQSAYDTNAPFNPIPENRAATIPESSTLTPLSVSAKESTEVIADKPEKARSLKSITIDKSKLSHPSFQPKLRTVSVAQTSSAKHTSRVVTVNKVGESTFTGDTKPKAQNLTLNSPSSIVLKTPQISMASLDQPTSSSVEPVISEKTEIITTDAPKPRATEPVLVAELTRDTIAPVEVSSNPVLEYITANDVRPDDIRLAVDNYRAALLDDGSEL